MGERIFAADWRACQEEHLRAVVAAGDGRNEATLVQLLQEIGFDEERLSALGTVAAPLVEEATESPPPGGAETDSPPAAAGEAWPASEDARQPDEPVCLTTPRCRRMIRTTPGMRGRTRAATRPRPS